MITSKLTDKAQTTIPQAVRRALGVEPGDKLAYVIESDGRVVIAKAKPMQAVEDPFATFTEWDSEADHKAYDDW